MACSDDSLGEDKVDDEEQKHSRIDKDLGSNTDGDIARIARPNQSHSHRSYSCHAETKNQGGHDELLLSVHVDLEDGHVCRSGDNVQG